MPDIMSPEARSERMARVRSKDSKPEKRVRSQLHRMGYRFRLHSSDLPGHPDIVMPKHRKVILMHGCYWHRHGPCRPLVIPVNNSESWRRKFENTVERDKRNTAQLREQGWSVLVVWECETKNEERLKRKLARFLKPSQS